MSDVQSNQSGDTVPQTTGVTPPTPAVPDVSTGTSNVPGTLDTAETRNVQDASGVTSAVGLVDVQQPAASETLEQEPEGSEAPGTDGGGEAQPQPPTEEDHVSMLMWLHHCVSNWRAQIRAGRFPNVD